MTQPIFLLCFLFIGFIIGGLIAWFIVRSRMLVTYNASQLDYVKLNEHVLILQQNKQHNQQQLAESQQQINQLRNQYNETQNQCVQLTERAQRVVPLEQQLINSNEQLKILQEQVTKLSTQLAERVQNQQDLIQRLNSAMSLEKNLQEKVDALQTKLQQETNQKATLAEQTTNQVETITQLTKEKQDLSKQNNELIQQQRQLTAKVAELSTQLELERRQNNEKIELLNEAKEQLANQFKALANDILEEKTKRFTEQNQSNIEQILSPLKIKLQEFQGKVEEVYVQEGKDRSALAEQVKQLMSLNQQLSKDAHSLTKALKGQAKVQGNWGEFILERVLENSGLIKDQHYKTQVHHTREDGSRAQPDVIIYLPEGKHLVIDAKVSIVAYHDYVNAEHEAEKNSALKRHLDSIYNHIKGLSSRNYQELYQLKSLDFVILFVPVEPAFMLAIAEDAELWQQAWEKNILLVSPSTLLFVVRTVANLWRQEQQTRNAQEIAKRGGDLYDKFVGFVDDLEKVGERLKQAQTSYETAFNKLANGRGNLIKQAENLKELGVKSNKTLSANLIELANDSNNN